MTLKINFKRICSFIIIVLITSSCKRDNNTSSHESTDLETGTSPSVTTNLTIEPSHTFGTLELSMVDYDYWNSNSINKKEPISKLKTLCKSEIYSVLKDDFDFIIVVMNNTKLPSGMPYGEYHHIKNDIQGIGLSLFNSSSEYGSNGKLQGIYFLYTNNIDNGPVIHEMFHRWANWVVPQIYVSHWDKVKGILTSVSNNIADIELYLAGAISASDIKDPESLAIYNDTRFTNKTRIPNSTNSQKSFKSLLLVMSPSTLTNSEITTFKNRITNITTHAPSNYQNLYNKSRRLLSLSIGELDKSKK